MSLTRLVCCMLLATCATIGSAQTEWILDPEGPVLEPAPPGSWDHGLRFIEAVVEVDGTYHMFYRGQPDPEEDLIGTYSIGHATSGDGVSWTLDPANPVFSPGSETDWDRGSIRGAAVIHDGERFRMWYASVSSVFENDEQWLGVGHATSTDGTTWSRSPENPIIAPGNYGTFTIPQTVIFDGEWYRMWYAVSGTWGGGESPASSFDGMSWGGFVNRQPDPFFPLGLSVVENGTVYYMMYWGWGYWPSIGGAVSATGVSWSDFVDHPLINFAASPAVLVDGDALVMWYTYGAYGSDPGIYRATSTCCDTPYSWFVLAAASGAGAAGSMYRTEVEINNANDDPAEYRFAWFPRDRDNTEWIRSGRFQIEPGTTDRYTDVLSEVFRLGPDSFGALAVETTTEDVLVAARISTSDDQTAGAYGQSIPVVRVDDFYSSTLADQRILFGAENADERFNITCFYGRNWRRSDKVELKLRDADGTLLGTERMTVQPFGSHQINRIFADHRPVNGYVQVERGWGTYCFGSRIDNQTNDPTTILPQ